MSASLKVLTQQIVANPRLHARWLNTFSYLEYMGFRKIVKSQTEQNLTAQTISHALEEGRHALRLKKLAMQLGGEEFNSYAEDFLLCPLEAKSYFQTLDGFCESCFEDRSSSERSRLTYLYVTWLVEERALEVYQTYSQFLESNQKTVVSGMLVEEDRHLEAVRKELKLKDLNFLERQNHLKQTEFMLYTKFLDALTEELK